MTNRPVIQPEQSRTAMVAVLTPLVVFAFTFAVFVPTLAAGFVDLDDFDLLLNNERWRGLSWEQVRYMFTTTLLGHYQPVTWLTFGATYEMAGLDPSAYHFGNVLIHSINAVLVYLVALRLVRAAIPDAVRFPAHRVRMAAGIGALAWAAHPLRVESVAWVTERRDVLSTMFLLLALLSYLRMVRLKGGGGGAWIRAYLWAIGLLMVSLLSKPWGMSFFVIVLLLDWYPLRRLSGNPLRWLRREQRGVLIEKVPFAVLGVVFMVSAGMAANSAAMAMRTLEEWPLASRIAQAAYGLMFYLRRSIIPTDLAVLYELPQGLNPLAARYVVCYAMVAVLVAAGITLRKRCPALLVVGAIYAALLAPVLGFFQSGDQFVADRYSYLAAMGWSLLFGAAVALAARWAEESRRLHSGVVMAGAAAVLLTSGVQTLNQSMVWRDSLALWEHAVEVGAGTPYVRVNYGLNLERRAIADERLSREEQKELLERAIEQFQIAARDKPSDGKAAYCMGNTLRRVERYEEAAAAYGQAAKAMPQAYMALVNRGTILIDKLGRAEEGLESLRAAVADVETPRTGPTARRQLSGRPHLALGSALAKRGDVEGAKASFRNALRYADSREAAEGELRAMGERP